MGNLLLEMKTFFAALVESVAVATHDPSRHADYSYDHDYHGNVPSGDFNHQVHDFNEWEEIRDQHAYEERLETEAELVIALEALREALVDIDHEIDELDDCISSNDSGISHNDDCIADNDHKISDNDSEIDHQRHRVEDLQSTCRRTQRDLDEDRDFLVLHCQQFA